MNDDVYNSSDSGDERMTILSNRPVKRTLGKVGKSGKNVASKVG